MITRCPNCGAVASLDSLLAGEDAADLLVMVAALDAGVGKAALRYLGLFRPGKGRLTFSRSAKLLGELMPDMQRQAVSRGGVDYPAPPAAWLYGFQTALEARDTGRLKLPLKGHGWLYEVIAGWQGEAVPAARRTLAEEGAQLPGSTKLRDGVGGLIAWAQKGGGD